MSSRRGIMGGTFDPIHNGHLIAAEEARWAFDLDRVDFVPTGVPWQKEGRRVAPAEDRYTMAMLATASNPAFDVSRIEIERPGRTYAVDTLRAVRDEAGPGVELYFITGADAILQILSWKEAESTLELATFIGVARPGYDLGQLEALGPLVRDRVRVLEIPALAVSSTMIRERVSSGRPIRYLVPSAVDAYIRKRGLYAAC